MKNVRHLELLLEEVPEFNTPSKLLEQYITPSRIAAHLLWEAYIKGMISNRVVIDPGCGTGKLAYGALLLGASQTYCIDIDNESLNIAKEFIESKMRELNVRSEVEFILADVRLGMPLRPLRDCTVIMNPPFGVWFRGADLKFLNESLKVCRNVFSIHKASQGFLRKVSELEAKMPSLRHQVMEEHLIGLRMSMPHHKKRIHYVRVVTVMFNNSAS